MGSKRWCCGAFPDQTQDRQVSTNEPTSSPQTPKPGQHQLSGNSAKSQDAPGPTALHLRGVEPPLEFTLLVARETLATKMN